MAVGSNVVRFLAILLLACGFAVSDAAAAADYDVILRGGLLIDGSGEAGEVKDLAIRKDRIAAIGDLSGATAELDLDATGQVVAPGFINMLSWAVGSLIQDGRGLSDIKQGVTLEVFGEGWSMGPMPDNAGEMDLLDGILEGDFKTIEWKTLGEYLEFLENRGVSPNVASFVGATTLRIHEVGFEDRPPTAEEMENMKALTRQAMEEGAMGLGSSLIYPPAFFASTEELVELSKVVGEYGGRYISHMRSEGNQIEQSIEELITIAREAGIGAEIYHLKLGGRQNWDKLPAVVRQIENARAEGLDITADMYNYVAGGTSLTASFPPWASDGGTPALLERLKDPETRTRIVAAMRENASDWENLYFGAGPEGVMLMGVEKDELKPYIGRTIAEIAAERGTNTEETVVDLVLETEGQIGAMFFLMSEENVRSQIQLPWMSFGSDAEALAPEGDALENGVHPRAYGNFARLLGKYVRDEGLIPLEEAIYKLTSLPAENLKIRQRGALKEGYFADVVVFDPESIADRATFSEPHQLAVGMTHVFVNGEQVLDSGEHTGALPGRVVRGPGYRPGAAGSASTAAGVTDPDTVEAFVDGLAEPLMRVNNSPSGTVAIAKNGEQLLLKGYGYEDIEQEVPVDPATTLFRPGSVSKLFTWVAVMQMVEQGKLDLDADVNEYLTQFKIRETFDEPITMRHIMTHTAGFEDGSLGYLIIDDESRLMPLAESLERYQPERVNPPGVQSSYSNYATALAGLIVANLSGQRFEDYIQEHIFDVLGMAHSSFEEPLPGDLAATMAKSYGVEAGAYIEKPYELISNFGPAGALASTATDMLRFAQAILNGGELDGRRILQPATVEQMLTRTFTHDERLTGMTLGFYETGLNGALLVGHGGDTAWFHSDLGIDRENGLVFFVSFSGSGGSQVRSAFAKSLYDRFYPVEDEFPEPPEDFSERAAKYTGSYAFWRRNFSSLEKALGVTQNLQVVADDKGYLLVAFAGGAKRYAEVDENLFQEAVPGFSLFGGLSPKYVAFQENEDGQITGFVLDGLPFMSVQKLATYQSASFNTSLLAISFLVFLLVLLRRFFQRKAIRKWPAPDRAAYRWAVIVALANIAFAVMLVVTLTVAGDRLGREIPLLLKVSLALPVLATLSGLVLLYQDIRVWSAGLLASVWARLRFTVITLCGLFMCWFYYYWNLLGWQYMI